MARRDRRRRVLAATLALASLFACKGDRVRDDGMGALPSTAAVPVTISFLSGFDDEGIIERMLPMDSAPGPYVLAGDIYADAQSVATVIAPGTRVTANAGLLMINGRNSSIHVRYEGSRVYAPVRAVARLLGAYVHTDPSGLQLTLWPSARLCEYRQRADPRAPIYRGASAEGLFARCRK